MLAIILAAQAMAVVDSSVVTTALPSIHAALHFSPTGLSWVQNAYTLPFGRLPLLEARAGDLLGRRRVFAAGVDQGELISKGIGPVSLEERIRFHREIRPGEEVEVSCVFVWGAGKSFRVEQEIRMTDGTLAAEITNTGGLLDLRNRRLIPDPGRIWRSAAKTPGLLGL